MKTKFTRKRIGIIVAVICILAAAWVYGGDYAEKTTAASGQLPAETNKTPTASTSAIKIEAKTETKTELNAGSVKDQYQTEAVPEDKPAPVEPENSEIKEIQYKCTLSVVCGTILDNLDSFNKDKLELLPADGIIMSATEITFYEGETVFNVLQREMKLAGIQMEFAATPIYNSNYIEGINNIYEFECGELSGWMYKVNGWFPNYGCSRYKLKEGDIVELIYTCDLGRDVGGDYSANKGGE